MNPAVIYLDPASRADFITAQVLARFPDVPVLESAGVNSAIPDSLFLTRKPGHFVRPCPGTKNYLCCGYRILDFVQGCDLGCHYCVLQAYLDFPGFVIYTNWEQIREELEVELNDADRGFLRLGTGQFTDSLLLDDWLGFSRFIIPQLVSHDRVTLELKTKTDKVSNLCDLPHRGKVIVSWSLNTEKMIEQEEEETCSLEQRLQAAKLCQDWGYRLGFHFDPLIYHQNWEEGYRQVIERLFVCIKPENIAWISLGCLRFSPSVPKEIQKTYPASKIIWEEFILGEDGKLRYFKPLRIKMYSHLLQTIRAFAPHVLVYLCMESPSVWQQVFGFTPKFGQLKGWLDEAAAR